MKCFFPSFYQTTENALPPMFSKGDYENLRRFSNWNVMLKNKRMWGLNQIINAKYLLDYKDMLQYVRILNIIEDCGGKEYLKAVVVFLVLLIFPIEYYGYYSMLVTSCEQIPYYDMNSGDLREVIHRRVHLLAVLSSLPRETFNGNIIYSQSFWQKSAERKSLKKYLFIFLLVGDTWPGVWTETSCQALVTFLFTPWRGRYS